MRYERLVIEAGSNTFSLNLHPRLTIIAGVGKVERDGLCGELVGALGSSRPGVHLEVVDDRGRRLTVFRPAGARHRVVDIDESADVSDEYLDSDGRVDLLARAGVDSRVARRSMRLTAPDLTSSAHSDDLIRTLAQVDQTELWSAAARVRVTDDELNKEAEAVGSAPEDAEIVERIEQRHQNLESAVEKASKLRRHAVFVGGASALVGVPVAVMDPLMATPVLAIGGLTTAMAFLYRQRAGRAEDLEQQALNEAGAESYLGFHLQRVNGLLSNQNSRRRLMAAAEDHREAAARWAAIAGDISVDWALEHHEEIAAAARLRNDIRALNNMSASAPMVDNDTATDLAHALISRLAVVRTLGSEKESFPLIIDDALAGLDPNMKPPLLEMLTRTAGSPQVIYLTEDEDVASWARLEALTGELSILEPAPKSERPPAEDRSGQAHHAGHRRA